MVRWDEYVMNPIALIFPTTHLLDFAKLRSLVSDDRANCSGHDVACSAYCPDHTKYDICIRMSKLERITVTMPAEMAAKLRAAVEEGSYATSSEIVREAVRAWVGKEDRRQAEIARIRALIAEGEASEMLDGETVLKEFEEEVARLVAEQQDQQAA
jgi:antitoxin ParD1/3/4